MASNDALISKTVKDAASAWPNDDVASKHVMDEIYLLKTLDKGDAVRLKSDYSALSTQLHEAGLLPGLTITDSSSGSVTVTNYDGKVQTLDAHSFGKNLVTKCPPPVYDPAVGDQNPGRSVDHPQTTCERIQYGKRFPQLKKE